MEVEDLAGISQGISAGDQIVVKAPGKLIDNQNLQGKTDGDRWLVNVFSSL